jgi:hypothetical protein
VLDLFDKASVKEPGVLLSNCLALLLIEAVEALLHWLGIGIDVEVVLGNLMRDVRHVGGLPSEDVGVVTQELYEGRFHV